VDRDTTGSSANHPEDLTGYTLSWSAIVDVSWTLTPLSLMDSGSVVRLAAQELVERDGVVSEAVLIGNETPERT